MKRNQSVRSGIALSRRVHAALTLLVFAVLLLAAVPISVSAADSDVPVPLANAVSEALAVWAQVATTGDNVLIGSAFVGGGPQYRQLEAESSAWDASDSLEPLRFTIRELLLRTSGPEHATVWASVEVTRVGFESETHSWDFDLIGRGGRWQVWTVLAADRPQSDTIPHVESSTTSTTSTTSALDEEPSEQEHTVAQGVDSGRPSSGVRLPAMSAWIVVVTVIGVALAGYLAPRLDRRREQ